MKRLFKFFLFSALFLFPLTMLGQQDSIFLVCPFEHGSGREPKEAFTWNPPDNKVIMTSHVDTLVRSCVTGGVVKVTDNGEGKYELVIYSRDAYFWYNNISKPLVSEKQAVKAGQTIGIYKWGDELEFRMYKEVRRDSTQMIDPRNLLECKVPKAE